MSLQIEKKRLLSYVKAYKDAIPEAPEPLEAEDGEEGAKKLPNDAARANKAIRTRESRHGSTKLTPEGSATLSKPKK